MSAECSLPNLTPECPFYETTADGDPACAEQCIDFIARFPGDHASRRDLLIAPGLQARRQSPKRREPDGAVAPFDGGQFLIEDQDRPVDDWRIVSLVVALMRFAFSPNYIGDLDAAHSRPNGVAILGELKRRGFDPEYLTPMLAQRRATSVALGLSMYKFDHATLGKDFTERSEDWALALGDLIEEPAELMRKSEPIVRALISMGAAACVTDAVPTRAQFTAAAAVPLPDGEVMEEGNWFVDRFSGTYLGDWTPSSLRREWEFIKGRRTGCAPPAFMRARVVPSGDLAELLADAHCVAEPTKSVRGASPDQFFRIALGKIKNSEFEQAAALYRASLEVWPDRRSDLPNNLGFCLIPVDPSEATEVLKGALPDTGTPVLTRLNLVVAQHLDGGHEESRANLEDLLHATTSKAGDAWVWMPRDGGWAFEFVEELIDYAEVVAAHLAECVGGCSTFAGVSVEASS